MPLCVPIRAMLSDIHNKILETTAKIHVDIYRKGQIRCVKVLLNGFAECETLTHIWMLYQMAERVWAEGNYRLGIVCSHVQGTAQISAAPALIMAEPNSLPLGYISDVPV